MLLESDSGYIQAINEGKLNIELMPVVRPAFEGKCSRCLREFEINDKMWAWAFPGQIIYMHLTCFVDWLPRVQSDRDRVFKVEKTVTLQRGQSNTVIPIVQKNETSS